jgi:hypothetical protein
VIEDYTENQIRVMLMTFLSTCCDEELLVFYDVFFCDEGFLEFPEYENMTQEEIDENEEYESVTENYSDEQIFEIRDFLHEFLAKDYNDDMKYLSAAMSWIFGLEYVGTIFNENTGHFVYQFDDGFEECQGKYINL